MRIEVVICLLVVIYHAESATTGSTCTSSYSCGAGSCCRDSNSRVISTAEGNGIFGGPIGLGHQIGTCSSQKAQKGEMCNRFCQCDKGLSCYRPISGACCPPSTCVDATYAKQQHAYWSNCFSNPNCALPP